MRVFVGLCDQRRCGSSLLDTWWTYIFDVITRRRTVSVLPGDWAVYWVEITTRKLVNLPLVPVFLYVSFAHSDGIFL